MRKRFMRKKIQVTSYAVILFCSDTTAATWLPLSLLCDLPSLINFFFPCFQTDQTIYPSLIPQN